MTGCGKCAGRPLEEALAEAVSCRPDFLPVFALLLQLDEDAGRHENAGPADRLMCRKGMDRREGWLKFSAFVFSSAGKPQAGGLEYGSNGTGNERK